MHATEEPSPAYIVEIQPGCWLAPWDGDPGRTLVRESAEVFYEQANAFRALGHAAQYRSMLEAKVVPVLILNGRVI